MSHPNGRGYSPNYGAQSGQHRREVTHCKHGHEFTPENTRWQEIPPRNPGWPPTRKRACKICLRAATDRYNQKKKNEKIIELFLELQAEGGINDTSIATLAAEPSSSEDAPG